MPAFEYELQVHWLEAIAPLSVFTQIVGDGVEGLAVLEGFAVIVGAGVGYRVEEPPPHTQHISFAVKSSSA